MTLCGVCNKKESVGVAASSMAAMSIAWCEDCLRAGVEPYDVLVVMVGVNGGWDGCNEWFHEVAERSLRIIGKTREELEHDAEVFIKDFDAASEAHP